MTLLLQRTALASGGQIVLVGLALACGTLAPHESAADEPEGQRWALIVAAAPYTHLEPGRHFAVGAAALRESLLQSGYSARNIRLLSPENKSPSKQPTAGNLWRELEQMTLNVNERDTLVVAIFAHGIRIGKSDYICAGDARPQDVEEACQSGQVSPSLVAVQELVEMLATTSASRLLLLDSGGSRDPLPVATRSPASQNAFPASQKAAEGFGDQLLAVDTTWLLCGRSGQLVPLDPDVPEKQGTAFTRSIVDGLAGHADADGNKQVSVFEISRYVHHCADAAGYIRPSMQGKFTKQFDLASVTQKLPATGQLSDNDRRQLFNDLTDAARRMLFLEQNPTAARASIVHAEQYATTDPDRRTISQLEHTSLALSGDLSGAWRLAQQLNQPLFAVVTKKADVFRQKAGLILLRSPPPQPPRPGERFKGLFNNARRPLEKNGRPLGGLLRPVVTLEPGMIVQVTAVDGRVQFQTAFRYRIKRDKARPKRDEPRPKGDAIVYEPVPNVAGWIQDEALEVGTNASDALGTTLVNLYAQ